MAEADQRCLGGAIGHHADARHDGGIGADIDDCAAPLPFEGGAPLSQHMERPGSVDIHARLPVCGRQAFTVAEPQYAGGIDENVEPAPFGLDRLGGPLHRRRIGDVECDLAEGRFRRSGLEVEADEIGPFLDETFGDAAADALSRTRYQHAPPGKSLLRHLFCPLRPRAAFGRSASTRRREWAHAQAHRSRR